VQAPSLADPFRQCQQVLRSEVVEGAVGVGVVQRHAA
jgi:hypothetical protein